MSMSAKQLPPDKFRWKNQQYIKDELVQVFKDESTSFKKADIEDIENSYQRAKRWGIV